MSRVKPMLAGGAAAAILAGTAYLFPPFADTQKTARTDAAEFARAQSGFAQMLGDPRSGSTRLHGFGFQTRTVPGTDDARLVSEQAGECAGQGIYWIRENAQLPIAITAPHRGSDRYTGQLASALFLESRALATAWNSAPRRPTAACEHGIDLAREKQHMFSAFALGFAEAVPKGLIVQLHGFDGERRHSIAAQGAGMILSNGTEQPGERLLDLADCLSIAFAPTPVLVYPIDTGELGALNNAQGQLLRQADFNGFVHLEISSELRAAMIEDAQLRAKLIACLAEVTT